MAKIFKVSGYFVDANGVVDKEKFEGKLESLEDLFSHHLHVEEADIGKWNDESPLNYDNCDLADCEKYFKRKVPVETDRKVEIGKTYMVIGVMLFMVYWKLRILLTNYK